MRDYYHHLSKYGVAFAFALFAFATYFAVTISLDNSAKQAAQEASYQAQVVAHEALVKSCERNKEDRSRRANTADANRRGWEQAEERAQSTVDDPNSSPEQVRVSREAVITYAEAAEDNKKVRDTELERADKATLDPELQPLVGRYDCTEAFPAPKK
jgi:hypothetical protein